MFKSFRTVRDDLDVTREEFIPIKCSGVQNVNANRHARRSAAKNTMQWN